jgi:parvulin-like peptidyl-prolyl isomerase
MEQLRRAAQLTTLIREATPEEREVLKSVLHQLVREELILEEAERLGLSVTEAELAQRMDEIRADYPDQTFEDTLVKDFQLKDEWKAQVRRTLLIEKAFQLEVKNRIRPDPKALEALYETHRAELVKPMAVRFLHITTDARAKTEKARQRVLSGEDFERVARDNQAPEAALLQEPAEWIDPRYLPDRVRKAVEATPLGRVSPVVESEYGYSIFKVLEVRPARPMTLEEAAAHLRRQYQALMETKLLEEWLTRLEKKAKIRIQPGLS